MKGSIAIEFRLAVGWGYRRAGVQLPASVLSAGGLDFLHFESDESEGVTTTKLTEAPTVKKRGAELAARIRARDQDAIEEVVHSYLDHVLRAARASGLSPQNAEDVTQATFVTFLEVAPRFEGRSHVRTFLFGILYKKIAEARRGLKRDQQMDPIEDRVERRFKTDGSWQRPPMPIDLRLEDAEIRQAIDDCLEQASTQQRLAFALREVLGFTTEETCKILDVTRTNLGVLLFRARNRLRECLETRSPKEKQ